MLFRTGQVSESWSRGGRITGRWVGEGKNNGPIDRLVLLDPALRGGNKNLPLIIRPP